MGMEEVLDTTGVPGATRAETSARAFALAYGSSVTASTTAVRVLVRPVGTSVRDGPTSSGAGVRRWVLPRHLGLPSLPGPIRGPRGCGQTSEWSAFRSSTDAPLTGGEPLTVVVSVALPSVGPPGGVGSV